MKKVKLMLLSLSILAVLGGALAFTAKGGYRYCTALPYEGICPYYCPVSAHLRPAILPDDFVCTAPTIVGGTDLCHTIPEETVQCVRSANSTIE